MPSNKPRINMVLEESLYEMIKEQAEEEGISLSRKTRDLLKLAMEIEEDRAIDSIVDRRKKNEASLISHDSFWADHSGENE